MDYSENIEEFKLDGITVFADVFDREEVKKLRDGLHEELLMRGVSHEKIINGMSDLSEIKGPRIKSEASDLFYGLWKINSQLNFQVYDRFSHLISRTFGSGTQEFFTHPFGKSSGLVPYFDRVCWRLPDKIRAEGGLGLHLDRNPYDPYLLNGSKKISDTKLKRWRPIQGFICLTDHYDSSNGGLQVVKGFHKKSDEFFKNYKLSSTELDTESSGEFYRMGSKKYCSLEKELQPVYAEAGSLVCWDNRLPHSTSEYLLGNDTREVIYVSYLPDVPLNIKYHQKQLECLSANIFPPQYLSDGKKKANRDWSYPDDLSEYQKELLRIN